jgi:hypothetical protein
VVKYIEQQQWSKLAHVVSVGLEEVEEFSLGKWMVLLVHVHKFKAFLLYCRSKICCSEDPTDDEVMLWSPNDLIGYCSSKAYRDNYAVEKIPFY